MKNNYIIINNSKYLYDINISNSKYAAPIADYLVDNGVSVSEIKITRFKTGIIKCSTTQGKEHLQKLLDEYEY